MSPTLHNQIVEVASDYLGPVAGRFVGRHITAHLNKEPEEIVARDLPALEDWMVVSLSLLTADHAVIEDFTKRLRDLAP